MTALTLIGAAAEVGTILLAITAVATIVCAVLLGKTWNAVSRA
jgi:hypothetical protein